MVGGIDMLDVQTTASQRGGRWDFRISPCSTAPTGRPS